MKKIIYYYLKSLTKKYLTHKISVKGGEIMTNCGCVNTCCNNNGGVGRYAFVLVLFILLVICGAAFWF